MKVVVTGGAGFIGSVLAQQFATDHEVYVIDLKPLPAWFHTEGVTYICADISEFSEFFDCDLIIHTASPVGPVGILSAGGEMGFIMVSAVRQVTHWALARNAKLIFVSSSEIYGRAGRLSEDSGCIVASSAPTVRNEYAQAKLLSEIMVSNTSKLNPKFRFQIVRPFNVAGPGQLPEKGFVLPRFTIQALFSRPLTVYGDGSQRRAFTHVHDVANGIRKAAEADESLFNRSWNIGCPTNSVTIRGLAELVCSQAGTGTIEFYDPQKLHGPLFSECDEKLPDIDRAQSLLGWHPSISLEAIVTQSLSFWREGDRYLKYANQI